MGGAGKQLALTAAAMADRGHEVALFTYIGESLEHTLDPRIRYIVTENLGNSKRREYTKAPLSIRKVVKKEKPDVVISWRANAGCMAVIGCLGLRTKVVFSERSDPYMETNWMLKIATKVCDMSDGGVFQTEKAKQFYKRLNPKSIVCPNPVNTGYDLHCPLNINERRKEVVWVGRFFNVQKRLDIAIKAFKLIHESLPEYKFGFCGDGVDMDYAKRMVEKEGIGNFVTFYGAVNNVMDIIGGARLLVLSSDYEGIPNVVIEAFMSGTPVVATDCSPGGARVLIDNGRNGYIVPIGDFKALAQKSIEVIKDDNLSTGFVSSARSKLAEFAPNVIFDKWEKYLLGMINEK